MRLLNAMETYPGSTALDQALEAKRYHHVRIVVAHDTAHGREIVLAVTAYSDRRNNFDISLLSASDGPTYADTRCYRWTRGRAWDTAEAIPCPKVRVIDPARGPARPSAYGCDVPGG